jgi:hypothetical protein
LLSERGIAGSVWAGNVSPVASLDGITCSRTAPANHKFTRNTNKLQVETVAAATDYCTKACMS